MSKDSNHTYVHLTQPRVADIFEVGYLPNSVCAISSPAPSSSDDDVWPQDFCRDKLPDDEIYVPPHHQPINPEDEDDVVPDQHAAFGITRATQRTRDPAWKDLGLEELMKRGPKNTALPKPELPR